MAQGAVHEKLWTPANVGTLLRICLVPVFVVAIISPWPEYFPFWADAEASKPWIAAGIFILLAATDGLDGYLARSRGEVTNFGKFIDPLADELPSWVALVILTREFIVSGIRMVAASQGVVIAASWYGKAKTVAQIVAIVLFIVKDSVVITDPQGVLHNPLYLVSWLAMLIALALTVISMLDYFVKAKEILGFAPSGKRAKRRAGAGEAAAADAGEDEAGGRALSAQEAASISPEALDELAGRVLEAARAAGATVGTAESLTGGLVAATLTDVPGSSDVVRGGIVSYSSDVKRDVLGVGRETLALIGAVSEETACAMAEGARAALGCDVAVSATGIAGPGGAEPGKPVGTVWIGRADASLTCARCCHFPGTREEVRLLAVRAALEFALEALETR